ASAVAWTLSQCHFKVALLETEHPLAVRRLVSFCEAVYEGRKMVEGLEAVLVDSTEAFSEIWDSGAIPLLMDPDLNQALDVKPDILVDAILAKTNIGTRLDMASLVVGLGPGFTAGRDVHQVIETNRGHNLGRIIYQGEAEPDTGRPGNIEGFTEERVLRAPVEGIMKTFKDIGDRIKQGESVAEVAGRSIVGEIEGVLRGMIRDGTFVHSGLKVGDIDPRGKPEFCDTISEKARAIAGAVLVGIMTVFNKP
ncbi:MAG TPA: selenium-dependent molybdenum cofactor biosynthesis protein YqeB, partial [Thermodesulfobacteriota bacterium]|nr:selenium-dependent molybdenum cofactor biosynthesis protein YqeB [Thermodesulfobacteriota bacterium]